MAILKTIFSSSILCSHNRHHHVSLSTESAPILQFSNMRRLQSTSFTPQSSATLSHLISHDRHSDGIDRDLGMLLESARPFLRDELESVDGNMPRMLASLRAAGVGECWHKYGTLLEHLVGVYRILKIWKAPDAVCLFGLFHSAYSNCYIDLAYFPTSPSGRQTVRDHVGAAAERMIHLFCVVSRQTLIHDFLIFNYTDAELIEHLRQSEIAIGKIRGGGEVGEDENWRMKLRSLCPAEGIKMKHLKTGEDVLVSRGLVAAFLLMTMADFSEQFYGFQDVLFNNWNGRHELSGNNTLKALWPGEAKPGLWMNSVSKMGAVYTLIVREEEIHRETEKKHGRFVPAPEVELIIPPVFEGCTRVLDPIDHIAARDLYWEGVCGAGERAEEMLVRSVEKNPFVGEAYVVLGQIHLGKGEYEAAEEAAERGLRLLLEWGSPWDKRMTWQAWVAWCRVLLMKARERSWPQDPWDVLNLGPVSQTIKHV